MNIYDNGGATGFIMLHPHHHFEHAIAAAAFDA
jgi:hypothetical protein